MINAATELRDLVEEHLRRGAAQEPALATACSGLAQIGEALQHVQASSENWGAIVGALRTGVTSLRQALPALRGEPSLRPLLIFAERQLGFAELLQQEIARTQSDESTLA